jgi:glycerophosphoryl diester phosphodiesterase
MHNLTYDATSNAVEYFGYNDVYAADLTLEEAKVLNMGENFEINGEYPYRGLRGNDIPYNLRIATCEEVIDLIEANSNGKEYKYIIEIKSRYEDGYKAADKLRELIIEKDILDRTIWASSKQEVADYMKTTYPDMPRSADVLEVLEFYLYARMNWNLEDADISYIALQIPFRTNALSNLANIGTRKVINYAHKYNIAVQYWTVNDYDDALYLINNGADCIMSDYPDMVFEAAKAANSK